MLLPILLWLLSSVCFDASASALPCRENCARAAAPLAATTTAKTATAAPTTFVLQVLVGKSYDGQYVDVAYVFEDDEFAAVVMPGVQFAAYYTLSSTNQLLLGGDPSSQNSTRPHSGPIYFSGRSALTPIRCYKIPNPLNATTPFVQCVGAKPTWVFMQVCGNLPPIGFPAFVIGDSVSSGCSSIQLKLIPKKNPFG